jgi:hypothetical protein
MKIIIPKWIIVYLWFITIMTILFTMIGYFIPDVHIITDKPTGVINGTLNLYISRNVAIIVIYLFALFSNRLIVFKTVFILRGVIDLIDLFQDVANSNFFELPFPFILLIIDIYVLAKLYKLKK